MLVSARHKPRIALERGKTLLKCPKLAKAPGNDAPSSPYALLMHNHKAFACVLVTDAEMTFRKRALTGKERPANGSIVSVLLCTQICCEFAMENDSKDAYCTEKRRPFA